MKIINAIVRHFQKLQEYRAKRYLKGSFWY
jgi:hypothetical protein